MGARIEAIKRMQQSSPTEVMAGYLWHYVVNSEDHFLKIQYYESNAWFEMCHENDAYVIDILYLGQEMSFPLSTFMRTAPDYKSVLAITPQLLEWLENTHAVSGVPGPVVLNKSRRTRRRTTTPQQRPTQGMLNGRAQSRRNGTKGGRS